MKLSLPIHLFVVAPCLWLGNVICAEDWPMYRQDAGRRGVTTDTIPQDLTLAWKREMPRLVPAFRDERLHFDAGYEPVVSGGVLLVASSLTDSVSAYDSKTGRELWVYYTNGPVRLAPAIAGDAACFGSDDGVMYCVDLTTGKLRWKHRAAPSERRLLGNKRLISVWPIRGGPVVADGHVYFAAGVWPFEGVFVYCVEIETGKVVWCNDAMGYLFGQQPHNTQAIGGLAPQGYLLINGDELIVPCSNAYPARLNRHTGELIEFELPSAGRYPGGWFAALDPDASRAIRRGLLTFDDVINRRKHEGKVYQGTGGVEGLSRQIQSGGGTLKFDDPFEGVTGKIHSMVVAENALFVATREGDLACFRERSKVDPKGAKIWKQRIDPLVTSDDATETAKSIVAAASSSNGIAIVIGLDDGALTKSLAKSSRYHVVVFDDRRDRTRKLRRDLIRAGMLGTRVAVVDTDLANVELPPYVTTVLLSERSDVEFNSLLQTVRPFGGIVVGGNLDDVDLASMTPGNFVRSPERVAGRSVVRRVGELPGSTRYAGDFSSSPDALVRFPLGVLWFDDALAHFKRSPQPVFDQGTMVSRPKNWFVPRNEASNKTDYPLFPPVLSDVYTGRVLGESERVDLRSRLKPSSTSVREPSQYRLPGQPHSTKPGLLAAGQRVNPLTGMTEPRRFPKTYGCDGGVDYGDLYTLRSGTAAYYDKTIESGTVFLSGPRSGCTNSIIPSGGVLNVPYYYDGCTCSYPLPVAMSLVSMPETHEQWSSWGESEIPAGRLQRVGINFGAPGDRMANDGTLWLDYPEVGGPSPRIDIETNSTATYRYRHSMWMKGSQAHPWVDASVAEGMERCVIKGLKPGGYTVRLYFAAHAKKESEFGPQNIKLQGKLVLRDFEMVREADGVMQGIVKEFKDVVVPGEFTLELSAGNRRTRISGIELLHRDG